MGTRKEDIKTIQKKMLKQVYTYLNSTNAEKNYEKALELFIQIGQHNTNVEIDQLVMSVFQRRTNMLHDLILKGIKKKDAFSFYLLSVYAFEYSTMDCLPDLTKYDLLDKAAEYGDAEMKLLIGRIYLNEINRRTICPANSQNEDVFNYRTKSCCFIRQAASMGYPEAQYQYFVLCESKPVENTDITEGRDFCLKAAQNGHREAQFAIGSLLLKGDKYTKKNQEEGTEWLEKSAAQGNTDAMIALGDLCIERHEEFDKTTKWYKKAAKKGDPRAKCILMLLGSDEYDLYTDRVIFDLMEMSKTNTGASKLVDYLIANPDFSKEHGALIIRDSKTNAISIESVNSDDELIDRLFEYGPDKEITNLEILAESGNVDAMVKLGMYYYEAQNMHRAEIWYTKAAKRNDPRAKWYLTIIGSECYDLYETTQDLIDMSINGDEIAVDLVDFLLLNPAISATMGIVLSKDEKTNQITYTKPDENEDNASEDFLSESLSTKTDIYDTRFIVIKLFGHIVLYDDIRISEDELPKGYYCYEIRHGDNDYKPCHIQKRVIVNHMGLIISNRPIDLGEDGCRIINRRKREWKHTDDVMTLKEYMEKFLPDDTIM